MSKFILMFLLLFTTPNLQGQNLDSLKQVAKGLKSEKRALMHNEIGFLYLDRAANDSAIKYFDFALNALKNGRGLYFEGEASNALGVIYYRRGDYQNAIKYYRNAHDFYDRTGNESSLALSQLNLGLAFKGLNVYDKALDYLYVAAINLERLGQQKALSSTYNAIGNIHREVGSMDDAYEYLIKALTLRKEIEYAFGIAQSLHNLASWHLENGDSLKSLRQFEAALEAKSSLPGKKALATTMAKLGEVYTLFDSLKKAETFFKQSLKIRKNSKNVDGIVTSSNHLARLNLFRNEYGLAQQYIDTAYAYASKGKLLKELAIAVSLQKDLFLSQGDFKKALGASDELIELNTKILDEEKANALIQSEVRFNSIQKDLELAAKQAQVDILNNKSQYLILIAICLGIIMIIVSLLLRATRKVAKERKMAKERIQRLLSELNHRTKNHLQAQSGLIRRQLIKLKDSPAKEIVKDIDNQIKAINLIHQSLYASTEDAPETINLTSYVENIVENLMISFGLNRNHINLTLELEKIDIDIHKALPIGLILNESITNSFKYAFDGVYKKKLIICLDEVDKMVRLLVSDNGPGFDLASLSADTGGLRIMNDLAADISGTLDIESSKGTKVKLEFTNKS